MVGIAGVEASGRDWLNASGVRIGIGNRQTRQRHIAGVLHGNIVMDDVAVAIGAIKAIRPLPAGDRADRLGHVHRWMGNEVADRIDGEDRARRNVQRNRDRFVIARRLG